MLLFSLTFGNAACQAHTINYSPRVRISCSQCSHSYVIVNTQSQASRIKQVKHGIAASPAAPRNDRKQNQPFPPPLALSLRASKTSVAIPTPKTASKARLAEILLRKHRSCHNERGNLRPKSTPPHKKIKGKEKSPLERFDAFKRGFIYPH